MTRRDLPPELEAVVAPLPDAEGLRAVWHGLPAAPSAAPADDAAARDAAWARLSARLADPARVPSPDDDTPVVPLRPVAASPVARPGAGSHAPRTSRAFAWAAALTVAVLGGGAAWRFVPATVRAPAGSAPVATTLADGTSIVLSPGSTLRVSRALGAPTWLRPRTREVRLDGEAFFGVTRDGRGFVVRTADAVVDVLGTRFDVRSPAAGAGTRVAVEEGRVAVTPRAARSRTVLGAGDLALVRNGEAVRSRPSTPERLTAWRAGGLAAIDEPLAVVLAEVARRAGVEITVDATAAAVGPVSVYYPESPEPATVVQDLATAHGLTFTRTSRGFAVTGGAAPR